MKKRNAIAIVFAVLIILPVIINLFGWNIYTYITFGKKELIIGSSRGMSHTAWADVYEETGLSTFNYSTALDDITKDIIETDSLHLFAEKRVDSMFPYVFYKSPFEETEYISFEFPIPVLLVFPIVGLLIMNRKNKQNQLTHSIADSAGSE